MCNPYASFLVVARMSFIAIFILDTSPELVFHCYHKNYHKLSIFKQPKLIISQFQEGRNFVGFPGSSIRGLMRPASQCQWSCVPCCMLRRNLLRTLFGVLAEFRSLGLQDPVFMSFLASSRRPLFPALRLPALLLCPPCGFSSNSGWVPLMLPTPLTCPFYCVSPTPAKERSLPLPACVIDDTGLTCIMQDNLHFN